MRFIADQSGRLLLGGLISLVMGCGSAPSQTEVPAAPVAEQPSVEVAPAAPDSSAIAPDIPTAATLAESIRVEEAPTLLTPADLWQQLEQPGQRYVVLLRHALAPGTGDPANFQLDDCTTQRNLSAAGRSQAMQIGQAFRDRNIVVDQVLSSQWCRCLETATLMDLGAVEPYPALNSFFRDRSTAESQTVDVKQFLLEQADTPGVTVMVTHQVNITGLTEIVPRSGAAVVIEVDDASLTQIGQLLPAP
jgi:phosphohistidine phosphatase SixA